MDISIIIINYKTKEQTLKSALKAREVFGDYSSEIILIDNNSQDKSQNFFQEKLGDKSEFKLIFNKENLGFAKAVNQGIERAQGEYVLLLNSDVLLDKDLLKMFQYAKENKEIGIIGPRMVYPDKKLQLSFGRTPSLLNEFFRLFWLYKFLPWGTVTFNNIFNRFKFKKITQVSWVTGGCMLISKNVFTKVKGLDENYFFGVEDIDFCYQVKKNGFEVVYYPLSEVVHYHGQSSGGRRSVFKLNYERKGINYFIKKNFPNKKTSMKLINLFYKIKIYLIKRIENKNLNKIKDAVLAVTYNCNARCERCHIWKSTDRSQIKAEDLKNLPKNLKDVNISGGEPFLLPDLVDIIKAIKESSPKAGIVISTNGFATSLIEKNIKDILRIDGKIGVAISLDGGAKIHDKLRGIPGGYEKLMKTIKVLKENNLKNLKISFTLGDENIRELKKIYNLSCELGAEFSLTSVHSGDNYFGTQNKINLIDKIEEELDWLIKKELKSFNPKRWGRAYYTYGLKEYIKTGKRILPDYSGEYNIFIDPKKDIYACDVSSKKIGSIINSEFVLDNQKRGEECSKSWMICTARGAIKKHWIRAGLWLLKNKFLSL